MNRRSVLRLGGAALAAAGLPVLGTVGYRASTQLRLPLRVSATVEHEPDAPVRLSADVREPVLGSGQPAVVEFSLENASEGRVDAESPLPAPFGVLRAGSHGPVLRTDAYADEAHVDVGTGGLSLTRADPQLVARLEPGGGVSETYRIEPREPLLRPGTFPVVEWSGGFPCQFGDAIDVSLTIQPE